jgi:hypothetical protein
LSPHSFESADPNASGLAIRTAPAMAETTSGDHCRLGGRNDRAESGDNQADPDANRR